MDDAFDATKSTGQLEFRECLFLTDNIYETLVIN